MSINKKDGNGVTALGIAIASWHDALTRSVPQKFKDHPDAFFDRLRQIAYSLIEQHADVNIQLDVNGSTYLHLACRMGDFGLIAKLLQYGAEAYPSQYKTNNTRYPSSLLPPTDLPRFRTLARRYIRGERPSRKCPCWSGKSLEDCHAGMKEMKYPAHFRCLCGSGRPYGGCSCIQRNNVIVEHYYEKQGRIVARFNRDVPFDPLLILPSLYKDPVIHGVLDSVGILSFLLDAERPATAECDERFAGYRQTARQLAQDLCAMGMVDPAYCYAVQRSSFHPR